MLQVENTEELNWLLHIGLNIEQVSCIALVLSFSSMHPELELAKCNNIHVICFNLRSVGGR